MTNFLKRILVSKQIEYLTLNSKFTITECSWGVNKFVEGTEPLQVGYDVFTAFPELIGLEETFNQILQNQIDQFELKGIARLSWSETLLYFDIYIVENPSSSPTNPELLIIFEDTTEWVLKEQKITQVAKEYGLALSALEKTKTYIDRIIDSITDLLIVTDSQGLIKVINRATQILLGYEEKELLNQPISIIFDPQSLSKFGEIIRVLSQPRLTPLEAFCQTKLGRSFPVSFSCGLLYANAYEAQEFVWIGRDMTENKRVELQLRQQAERERLVTRITQRIRQSLCLEKTLENTVSEVRQVLQADRVLIYHFQSVQEGKVMAKSEVDSSLPEMPDLNNNAEFNSMLLSYFSHGKTQAWDDLYEDPIHLKCIKLLIRVKVRANLVIPIFILNALKRSSETHHLWGLLIVHQCYQPRHWETWEISLLEELAVQVAIAIQQAELYEQLNRANRELEALATIDQLTQLPNRRHFDTTLSQEWNRLRREHQPLTLILMDIDYFKQYNDTYGHLAGDFCLQEVANVLRHAGKRSADVPARYGGEEFALILPNTDLEGGIKVAGTIRAEIEALKIAHVASKSNDYVTVSLGVAMLIPHVNLTPQILIHYADNALYEAKGNGRNRVCWTAL